MKMDMTHSTQVEIIGDGRDMWASGGHAPYASHKACNKDGG